MKRIFEKKVVTESLNGLRLDKAAATLFADFSRNELGQWIKDEALLVNGKAKKVKEKVSEGDVLALDVEL